MIKIARHIIVLLVTFLTVISNSKSYANDVVVSNSDIVSIHHNQNTISYLDHALHDESAFEVEEVEEEEDDEASSHYLANVFFTILFLALLVFNLENSFSKRRLELIPTFNSYKSLSVALCVYRL